MTAPHPFHAGSPPPGGAFDGGDVQFSEQPTPYLGPPETRWPPPDPVDPPGPPAWSGGGESAAAGDGARPVRRRGRVRLLPRTLGNRLVLGVVSLVTLLVILTGAATYFALHVFLINRLDQQVQTTGSGNVVERLLHVPNAGMPLHSPQDIYLALLEQSSGSVLLLPSGNGFKGMQLTADERADLITQTSSTRTLSVTTTDGAHLRVTVRQFGQAQLMDGTVVDVTAVIGLSTDEVDRTAHRLLGIEVLIGAGAILVALGASAYGVRLSLRPLHRVTRTAREVSAELSPDGAGLDRRVMVTDTGSEVGQLAESVNTMLGAVETQFAARVASEERMRQFMADASHELRTPLTTIRGYAELGRMQRARGGTPDADTLDRIESEGTRMSRLVDDLLMLARSDQGAPAQFQVVDVSELVVDVVGGARAAHPQRRIDAYVPVGLEVYADPDQLLRVLRNLITNAAVHTAAPGAIRVEGARLGDSVTLTVVDQGPGLPAEEAAHVFERFWRADKARTRARGGTGLGLAIVASIVEAHGGSVRFESSVEGGSRVTVLLRAVED